MKEVIRGEKEKFSISLIEQTKLSDGSKVQKAFDLTGYTEIQVNFKSGSTSVSKTFTADPSEVSIVGADTDGKIETNLEIADSGSLEVGFGSIEIVVTKAADEVTKFQLLNSFQVISSLV